VRRRWPQDGSGYVSDRLGAVQNSTTAWVGQPVSGAFEQVAGGWCRTPEKRSISSRARRDHFAVVLPKVTVGGERRANIEKTIAAFYGSMKCSLE